jgi:small GTP-binding protein
MRGPRIVKKICILGDPAVGKTSLVGRYVLQQFGEEYLSTIGARVCEKVLELEIGGKPASVELVIWDIAGQNQFTSVTPSFYRGAEGALVVCDPSRRETFRNLFRWDHQFRENAAAPNVVLIFNKSDISDRWEVAREEAESLAGELGYPFSLASAKTGQNVEESFVLLARLMLGKGK